MWYAELILPLALDTLYHYKLEHIPGAMQPDRLVGSRVIVSLGAKRFYTGIIYSISAQAPQGLSPDSLKCIETILDTPAWIPKATLELWKWVASYYHCTLGQVMRQALPSALMPESETIIHLVEDFQAEGSLKPNELAILDELSAAPKRSLTLLQLHHRLGSTTPQAYERLFSLGAIYSAESINHRYKPRTISMLALADEYREDARLNEVLDSLKRAKRQQELLTITLGKLLETEQGLDGQIPRSIITQTAPQAATHLRQLLKRGILTQTEMECSRYAPIDTPKQSSYSWESLPQIHLDSPISYLYLEHTTQREQTILSLVHRHYSRGEQVLLLSPAVENTPSAHGLLHQLELMTGSLYEYHSQVNESKRADLYKHLAQTDEACVVVGTRSAVFLPLRRIGLIIIDSEEAYMYKQQHAAPYFHARDLALYLGASRQIPIVLMSATPSAEALFNILRGKYQRINRPLQSGATQHEEHHVDIQVIDIAHERHIRRLKAGNIISLALADAIREQLVRGQRVLLLQNRKGYAPYLMCTTCGDSIQCPRCAVSLCLHQHKRIMQCHHCGYMQSIPTTCPKCADQATATHHGDLPQLKALGYGIERVEEEVKELFSDAHILRLDSESIMTKAKARDMHEAIESGQADIIVGTQLIKSQPIWDNVGLVAVLQLDQILSFPDFRAEERAYQLLYQLYQHLSQRQGTQFILQCSNVDHPFISQLRALDYTSFIKAQLKMRQLFAFPPFVRLSYIRLSHSDALLVEQAAKALSHYLQQALGTDRVLGPISPSIGKVDLKYIQQIICKRPYTETFVEERRAFRSAIEQLRHFYPLSKKVQISYDIDPL